MSRWFIARSACDGPRYYRQDMPLKHLAPELAAAGIEINVSNQLKDAFDADVCMFSRVIGADTLAAILMLKQAGKIIVWDTDDDLTIADRYDKTAWPNPEKEVASFHACLNLADVITVSMPHLAKVLGREHKTVVLPNLIDLDDNPISKDYEPRTAILYCGTSTHHRDIELFRNLYENSYQDYPWFFLGIRPQWMDDSSTYIPLPPVQSYHKVCRLIRPLFAFAPLTVESFNLSKSPIKIWETATLGAYVVASNFGPYQGTTAGIVPAGETFTFAHLEYALVQNHQPACIKEAIWNSWQGSMAGPTRWLDAFLAIEDMANGR